MSVKAALISALVFPGAGHFFLKKYISAALLTCASAGALYYLAFKIFEKALLISEQIQSGEIPLDVVAISELISKPLPGSEAQAYNIALLVLLISWLIGIADSYRIGHSQKNDS